MNDLIILYVVFSFFMAIGVSIDSWDRYKESRNGLIIMVIFSSIVMPIYLGIYLSNNDKKHK